MAKVLVGKASDIGEGKMADLTAGGKEIPIANVGGQYYATGNTCSHAGAELHEGDLNGKELINLSMASCQVGCHYGQSNLVPTKAAWAWQLQGDN